jgi:PAS domain S-box-containing protein
MPFYVNGKAVGTIWVIAHDDSRRFETEDLRVMTNLGTFASSAYQTLQSLAAMQQCASIVESSEDAILSKDLDGLITSWNRGAERVFGYSSEEIIGKRATILFPPERQDEESAILQRVRRGERVGPVAGLVGNEGGVVSGVINLESSGVSASDWRPRHDQLYHEA